MQRHRRQWMWMGIVVAGVALNGAVVSTLRGQDAPVPAAVSAPTTIPVVPTALVSTDKGRVPEPPVRPRLLPTPPPGAITYQGVLPDDLRVSLPAFWCFGSGELTIEGNASVRLSGEGTLWVNAGSSMTLDMLTTFTQGSRTDGVSYDSFRGTARVRGSTLRLEAKGKRLFVSAEGRGQATLTGEGTFRLTQSGRRLVSGIWKETGTTQPFETLADMVGEPAVARPGFLPEIPPPDAKVYPIRRHLPSDEITTGAVPSRVIPLTSGTVRAAPRAGM